jgi:hypothetical protein
LAGRWNDYAFAARYGHQPISELRRLAPLELHLFCEGLIHWLNEERVDPA